MCGVRDVLTANGFEVEVGGGGCEYLTRYFPNGTSIMATCVEGGGMPTEGDWWLGVHLDSECHLLIRSEDVFTGQLTIAVPAAVAAAEALDALTCEHRDTGRGVCAHCGTAL
jgi:hypothetical protein